MTRGSFSALQATPSVSLAILASGQNPDGTPYVLPTSSSVGVPGTAIANSAWEVNAAPAVNTQAAAVQAAAGAGIRNVCTGFQFAFAAGAVAPAAVLLNVTVTDSLAFTTIWSSYISLPATAGAMVALIVPCLLVGTANNQMQFAFSAAGGANTFESVSAQGYQVQ